MPLSPHGRLDHGQDSLQAVAERLAGQHGVFWLLGASCTGKTTVCRRLAETCNVTLCDMDARIFGEYFDEMIAKTLEDQCRAAGIRLVRTHEGRDGAEAAAAVAECWKLR